MKPSRVRNIAEWSLADRCLLAAAIVLVFACTYTFAVGYYVRHPRLVDYVDYEFVTSVFHFMQYVFVGGWLAFIVLALLVRRTAPELPLLPYLLAQLYGVGFGIASYWLGHYTSLFTGVTIMSGTAIGLVLLERRPVLFGVGSYLAIVMVTTIAEQLGMIPYAPVFTGSPVRDGRLSGWWLATIGGVTMVLVVAVIAIVDYIVRQWRARERELEQTSEQLARASELVSRYVAAQVAEQIFAGNYSAVDKHERRKLTLFFSDIKGFSALADRLEPEETSQLLKEYFSEMTAIALRYGATIDKFIGDALMVFFGAPTVTEDRDNALRAVRMAVAMQQRVGELSAKWMQDGLLTDGPFQIRIGINSGIASVGNFGSKERMDYTAIGRQVNLAARLQVDSDPGKILLSHSTWVLVKDHVACTEKGEIHVKGMERAVRAYEVDQAAT